jgi:hypothetical protein
MFCNVEHSRLLRLSENNDTEKVFFNPVTGFVLTQLLHEVILGGNSAQQHPVRV